MSNRHLAYATLLLNAAIWGAALPIIKPALSFVTPYQYLFYRYLIAVPFSIPPLLYLLYKHKPPLKQLLTIISLEFIAITLALSFLYEGLNLTTSIQASLIANSIPVFVVIGGVLLLKEKEEKNELIGLIFAVIGVTILTLEPFHGNASISNSFLFGNLFVIGHNLFWTAYVLLAKKLYRNINKLLIGFISLWVGLISFFLLSLVSTPQMLDPGFLTTQLLNPPVLAAAAYMGLLGSIVAVPAYIYGNNLIEASEASLFSYLQPLFYVPLAILWLKEPFTPVMAFALVITVIGVIIAERRVKTHKG